jgi:putative membrane protein
MKMSDQKRQHPVMIILETIRLLKYGLPPLFFFALAMREEIRSIDIIPYLWGLSALVIAFFLYSALQWYVYTYRYENGYLYIKRGLIFKKGRSIKRERVQTVNIRTDLLRRLLGVATIQIETAGGGVESEIVLSAVKLEETHRIKSYLETSGPHADHEKYGDGSGTEYEKRATYVVPPWDLFLAGATSGRIMLLFSLIATVFSQFYPYIPENVMTFLTEQIIPASDTDIIPLLMVLLLLLFLSWILSILIFMIQYADFTVISQNDYLQVSWGLIEQKEFTLKKNRVQALSVQEGLLRQPFGLCALTLEVAGGGVKDQGYIAIICPILRKSRLDTFLKQILPEYRMPESMIHLPLRSRKRYLFRSLALVLIFVLLLQTVPYGWLGFLLLPPAFLMGLSRYRTGGTDINDKQLTLRFRNINRYHVLMMQDHVQSLEISSNLFQRRSNLSTIKASVLSSPSGKSFKVVDADKREVRNIWKWFSRS